MRSIFRTPFVALVSAATLASLTACASSGVTVERDPTFSLPVAARYAWPAQPNEAGAAGRTDPVVNNDIAHRSVQVAIDAVLGQHLWHRTTPDSATLLVRYSIGRRMANGTTVTSRNTYGATPVLRCNMRTCWEGASWGYYGPPVTTREHYSYPVGTLLIDLIDKASGRLVWRGIGTEVLEPRDLEQKRLQHEVTHILASVPDGR